MIEWTVVGVIVVLVGLFISIYTPLSKNTKAMTELTVTMKVLSEKISKIEDENIKAHRRLWEHEDKQDDTLNDHETRLKIIEKQK